MQNLINEIDKEEEAKAEQDLEDGIANLHEEEALRRHQDAPSDLKGGIL